MYCWIHFQEQGWKANSKVLFCNQNSSHNKTGYYTNLVQNNCLDLCRTHCRSERCRCMEGSVFVWVSGCLYRLPVETESFGIAGGCFRGFFQFHNFVCYLDHSSMKLLLWPRFGLFPEKCSWGVEPLYPWQKLLFPSLLSRYLAQRCSSRSPLCKNSDSY